MEINLERFVSENSSFITLWRIFFLKRRCEMYI